MINVEYYGEIKKMAGIDRQQMEAGRVSVLLKEIKEQYGADAYRSAKSSHIVVNGESAAGMGGFRCPLQDGDTVQLFPVCAGG